MSHGGRKYDPAHRAHLDSDERRAYLNPDAILGAFGIGPGMHVADIGAGTGFFALPAAIRVGPHGRIYAIDMAPEMLADLRANVARAKAVSVEIAQSTEDEIPLPDASVDFALLACVLHELEGPGTLYECRRILRPKGRLGVVEWRKIDQDIGPPREHRLSEAEATAVLVRAGFAAVRTFEAGPYHYGIEARIGKA